MGAIVAVLIIFGVMYKFPGLRPWTWFPSARDPLSGTDDVSAITVGGVPVTGQNVNTIDYSAALFSIQ